MSAGHSQEQPPQGALSGRRIAITRPTEQAPDLAQQLEAAGASVVVLSAIAIEPLSDTADLDDALARLNTYDWIVLTSVNGVHAVADRLRSLGRNWGERGAARIAVIGPATARALEAQQVTPDLLPSEYVAEALSAGLGAVAGQRILLLRADIARRTLAEDLRAHGATVDEVSAYRTVVQPPDAEALRRVLDDERPDAITFTSSSTVRGLLQSLTALGRQPSVALAGILLACIGPVTAATLREYGLEPGLIAAEYTMPGLVRAMSEHFGSTTRA